MMIKLVYMYCLHVPNTNACFFLSFFLLRPVNILLIWDTQRENLALGCHGDANRVSIIFPIHPPAVSEMQNHLQATNILGIRCESGRPAAAG